MRIFNSLLFTVIALVVAIPAAEAETYYFSNDHLGTPQVVTDASQQVVWRGEYSPFGEVTETVSSITQNLRFPGQYFDQESGQNYNYFRNYEPATGRYLESDPIGLMGGLSTFGYVGANPIRFTDPYGLDAFTVFGGWQIPFLGGVDVGFVLFHTGTPLDIGLYISVNTPDGGIAKGKLTVGAGAEIGQRCNFDGVGYNFDIGVGGYGGTVSIDPNSDAAIPPIEGISFQVGPQLGFEGNKTITGSITARDLGRAIASIFYGNRGRDIIGESCECN